MLQSKIYNEINVFNNSLSKATITANEDFVTYEVETRSIGYKGWEPKHIAADVFYQVNWKQS